MGKFLYATVILMAFGSWVYGQNQISGTVSSPDDGLETLPGVTVMVEGTNNGTITDVDGRYSITASGDDVLIFSFVGYETLQVTVGSQTVIDISLSISVSELNEIIVTGYGTTIKKEVTGAISQIKNEDFENRTAGSVQEILAGIIPGVQVASNGGAPGSSATILVRGISTISGSNNPIYVVDGTILDDIEFLNPKDIESIQVLKDASAASIYGSRGSNGVIIIETKQGQSGKITVDFKAKYGVQSVAKKPEMADATEYAKIKNMVASNEGQTPPYSDPESLGAGTDWWDELTQTAPIQDYMIGISGGADNMRIASSVSYFNQDGIVKGGGYDRVTFRLNTGFDLSKWFTLGTNISYANSNYKNGPDFPWDLQRLEPVTPVYLPDYEQVGKNEFSIYSPTITDVPNAGGSLARNFSTTAYTRLIGNISANIKIASFLKLDLTYGMYNSTWENDWFSPTYYIEPSDMSDINSVSREHNNRYRTVSNNILTFEKTFGDHSLKVMGGVTREAETHRSLGGTGSNLPSNHPDLRYLDAAPQGYEAYGTDEDWSLLSFLGRVNYAYKGKYFLQSNFRADGSSKFPTDNKWASFPSVSVGWAISEEKFMSSQDNWLDYLKLRGAWGQIGNQGIPIDAKQSNLYNVYYISGPNQEVEVGAAPESIGNDGLVWETIEDINVGMDLSVLRGQLQFSFDYYTRNINDMLLTKQLPAYLGLGFNEQWSNVGSMETKGFELELKYSKVISDDFSFSVGSTVTSSHSIMTKLNGQTDVYWDGNDQRLNLLGYTAEGGTPSSFFGYVTDGIFQTASEVNNYTDNSGNLIQPVASPGDFKFKDLNNDGVINDQDRKVIGNPEAFMTYGLFFDVSYKNFTLSGLFTGKVGGDIISPIKAYTNSGSGSYNSYAGLLADAWQGEGTSNSQPRVVNNDRNQNFRYSDYYIQDGSYFRLKNIQLSYSLPQSLANKISAKQLQVFISSENVFTATKYDGMDPDIGGYATLRGVDWGNYPLPRIISVGLNVSF